MPDPFEALRTAPTPIDPEAAFAARLRARLAQALLPTSPDQGEPSMTLHTSETAEQLRQGDMSYFSLWVPDVDRAARFYTDLLGWQYAAWSSGPARLVEGQSISLGLSELAGSADFQRSEGLPVGEALAPTGYPVFVVDDIQAAAQRVRAAGGHAAEPKDQPYGRVAGCVDDQGLAFSLHERVALPRPPATGARHGDVAYVVFEFPDAARARAFYAAVLGMHFEPGRTPDGWNVSEVAPMSGFAGGASRTTVVPMFRVDDIQAAVERVRAAGGRASEPRHEGYGTRAECADDQGVRFYLGQLA
jgi:predicted enzyme related to lactoylglutathione lyase